MEDWNDAIYRIIKKSNHPVVTLNEIYQEMKIHPLVTQYHLQPWKPGGQPRYECWTRRCLTSLIRAARIKRVARASYKLT